MKLSDFHFNLPAELIAHYPPKNRTDSRLLCLSQENGLISHRQFTDFTSLINPEDLLVFNNTRVIPARLFGHKESGGKVEVLVERVMANNQILAQVRASKSPKAGSVITFSEEAKAEVLGREGAFFILAFPKDISLMSLLEEIGHMPLPPYIKREDELLDKERYQTVYSEKQGAVAAPTAGLHFDEALLAEIEAKGIDTAKVTLHVGAGTFQPVRTEEIEDHHMHAEYLDVDEEVCAKVNACRARGGRVIAIGTTSVRCLETASASGEILPYKGDTNIFIYPGYEFKSVDALLTNFHLSESTLIMLVSALVGRENVLHAYNEAIKEQYRFFSYGDAMFIC
ncbi:tRNA preQ1(34) S-adenosylmethionine ribosyltransferase-isomerase QueA [Haliea sp. AH-315-K21]|uniref:S-adenosylmethionine:tRNA ribosyltransferase-isomerase n=1 Tax=SAR86 cluster bacterium TaxID=2030880 RepID=A0A2A5CBE8_9GAMM|nr:tRNA preQ1(34) S-adenosylmethionine ribosyltransferase-isomerase QueA [Haliea sp. AH-315-K21]PCJ41179.1 MAG: tRNA preQ1(34) S-adenosylmethionine ribosyltransferase-isomerase QueA [SAR86 cluster bacterium]